MSTDHLVNCSFLLENKPLKNLVYRVRTTFENAGIEDAKRLILCKRGIYRLNERIELWVDAEEFAAAAQLASTAQGAERQAALQRAVALYAGDYLSGEIRQAWVTPVREKLHSQYALCALPLMEQADEATDWEPLLALSGHSIEIDPFDGDAAYYRLRALLGLDQQPKALEYYNQLQNLYYRERGEKLPERVRGLYFDIIRHMNNIEIDIAKIKQDISEKDKVHGAFVCEYEVFKEMYRVEARAAVRTGQKMFIALFTLADEDGAPPSGRSRNRAMSCLLRTLTQSLRKGDIVAQFSATQYVVMMATRTYENGMKVVGRVERRFRAECRGSTVRLTSTLQPIDTPEET